MTKHRVAGLLTVGTLLFAAAGLVQADPPAGHEIRAFGEAPPGAVHGGGTSVGTAPADRVDTLGGLLGPIVSGTGDLSGTAAPPTAPGGTSPTLDTLLDDADAAAEARCAEIARADDAGLDRVVADLDRKRDAELARLDDIGRQEQRLAELKREMDRLDREIVARQQAVDPEDAARQAKAEGLKVDLDAARAELDRLRFERRQLAEQHEPLRARREAFAAASERLRAATARIDTLTREIGAIQEGRATVTSRLGDATYDRHHVQDLERQLADAVQARETALAEAGEVIYLPRPPASLAELAEGTSSLHAEWQQYQQRLQAIETRLRWLENERIPTLLRETAAAEAAAAAASARQRELTALEDKLWNGLLEQARAREAAAVDRVAAVLAYKLDAAVRDCIERRRVAGRAASAPATTATTWPQVAVGNVTRTCYGPTTGDAVELNRSFTYEPWVWRPLSIRIYENNTADIGGLGGTIYGVSKLYKNDAAGKLFFDGGSGHLDPATGRVVVRAEGRGGFRTMQGAGPTERAVMTDSWPFLLIGELRPDPAAPRGWRGQGRGQMGFKLFYRRNVGLIHASEPCEIEWTVP